MGCTASKSAAGAVNTSSNDPIKRSGHSVDLKGLKPGDKIGLAKRATSTTTSCTAATGESGASFLAQCNAHCCGNSVPCCAETHRSELSSHSDDHDHHDHHDHDHDDDDGGIVECCKLGEEVIMEESRRESLSMDDIFNDAAAAAGSNDNNKVVQDSVDHITRAELPDEFLHIDIPHNKPVEEIYSGVRDGPVLGEGVCGIVRQITHRVTGAKFALKRLDLSNVKTDDELRRLREEIFIMCQLDHPNIVKLEEVYESSAEIFLVGEMLSGGELFDRLDEQPDYHYTEAECAKLVLQMLCAVRYIHSKGIVHRDLKLENFLFASRNPDAKLKMIDFGLSKHFNVGDTQCECVGTPYTVAPEVVHGRYDERCDVWGVGVLTFFLLSGEPPFGGCGGPEPLHEVRENILAGRYEYEPRDIWEDVSRDAKEFIAALLVTDPNERPTAREVQTLAWLKKFKAGRMDTSQSQVSKAKVVQSMKKTRSGDQLNYLTNLSIMNFDEDEVDHDHDHRVLERKESSEANMLPPLAQ